MVSPPFQRLQWGRRANAAESTPPADLPCVCWQQLQWGRRANAAESAKAAIAEREADVLQWGRRANAAESGCSQGRH